MKSINRIQQEIGRWGETVFPREDKRKTLIGLAHHLQDEADEVLFEAIAGLDDEEENERFRMELADVGILLFQLAYEAGINLEEAIDDKMEINYDRKWQAPDERGVVRHAGD